MDRFLLQRLDGNISPDDLITELLRQTTHNHNLSAKLTELCAGELNRTRVGQLVKSLIDYWTMVGLVNTR